MENIHFTGHDSRQSDANEIEAKEVDEPPSLLWFEKN
jgi:hypothetical protein